MTKNETVLNGWSTFTAYFNRHYRHSLDQQIAGGLEANAAASTCNNSTLSSVAHFNFVFCFWTLIFNTRNTTVCNWSHRLQLNELLQKDIYLYSSYVVCINVRMIRAANQLFCMRMAYVCERSGFSGRSITCNINIRFSFIWGNSIGTSVNFDINVLWIPRANLRLSASL